MTPRSRWTRAGLKQWQLLRDTLTDLGHAVHVLAPDPAADMVGGRTVRPRGRHRGTRPLRHPQRSDERRTTRSSTPTGRGPRRPVHVTRAGRFAYLPGGTVPDLAVHASGRRAAHARPGGAGPPGDLAELGDSAFYHLDTPAALDDPASRTTRRLLAGVAAVLTQLFPDAVLADLADAEAFGLNLVSDGRHVVLNAEAVGMAGKVKAAGYIPVPVELSELKRGGGSVKCAVAELRPSPLAR